MTDLLSILARSTEHIFLGRLGQDPETKYLQSGSVITNASLAVTRLGSKRGDDIPPDWFKLEIWSELGESFVDHFKKGDLVRIYGRIKTNTWTNKGGESRTDLIIVVNDWEKPEEKEKPAKGQSTQYMPSDEELPF